MRYEREAPGELLHMDTKKLGRIVRPSHRVTGDRRDSADGAGWEFAHVAIDDHSRASFVQMHEDARDWFSHYQASLHAATRLSSAQAVDGIREEN